MNWDRNFTQVCNGTILLFIVSTSQCNNIRENMVNIRTLGLQENGGKHFNMLVFICHQNEKQRVYTTHFCRLSKLDWEEWKVNFKFVIYDKIFQDYGWKCNGHSTSHIGLKISGIIEGQDINIFHLKYNALIQEESKWWEPFRIY